MARPQIGEREEKPSFLTSVLRGQKTVKGMMKRGQEMMERGEEIVNGKRK